MKHRILIICMALVSAAFSANCQTVQPEPRNDLEEKLKEYLAALDRRSTEIKCEEADFIIETCTDSTIRQNVAATVYRHFLSSRVMGDEAVAIHVFDRWFADGTVKMDSEADFLEAKMFATANRQSLIGSMAPEITLQDASGNEFILPASSGRYNVLYFYDTDCSKCRIESILLRNVLENDNFDIDLTAIYIGKDMEKWKAYMTENLIIDAPLTNVANLWDPQQDSGMETAYGVIQTPRIFLINPEGKIIGRGLDTWSLEQILSEIRTMQELYALAPIGKKLPKIKVPGTTMTAGKSRDRHYRLDKVGEATVIFHTNGCRICEMEIAAAKALLDRKVLKKVCLVDMDTVFSSAPDTANALISHFDLSSLPFILSTDKKSCIKEKYISLIR